MLEISRDIELPPPLGMRQALLLGTLVLGGVLPSVLLSRLGVIPACTDELGLLAAALWVVEAGVYGMIGWWAGKRLPARIALALGLGLGTRLLISLLTAVMLRSGSASLTAVIGSASGPCWLYHLTAMAAAAGVLLFPCRQILEPDTLLLEAIARKRAADKPQQFSFDTRRVPTPAQYHFQRAAAQPDDAASIHPPEGITPVVAAEGVSGAIQVPASVLLASVPEAAKLLETLADAAVPLALIVPQLRQATVWLTWQQIFPTASPQFTTELALRWVRIPARHYVPQVPEDYFHVTRHTPDWLSSPPVPQEDQLRILIEEDRHTDGLD